MWYFAWILGVGVALAFGVINVMWLEAWRLGQRVPVDARVGMRSASAGARDVED
ncbi:cytochrome bd-I oxidase subunit CydX [Paraburkholderia phosphatilytica]|uniref:cytochrome bd-I oxidase subunit CydX n=1 Tax=Paraburkholderia phosphatilytica TaxID=2282883 RepID=UPI000E47155E|nr:cytochrome bd-I oxidase subunit CydX [Paraburkholderia phosphatilytica]